MHRAVDPAAREELPPDLGQDHREGCGVVSGYPMTGRALRTIGLGICVWLVLEYAPLDAIRGGMVVALVALVALSVAADVKNRKAAP